MSAEPRIASIPADSRETVATVLKVFLEAQLTTSDPIYDTLVERIATQVARGGKRLRPLLTLTSYFGYGGTDTPGVYEAAASQELQHTFLLMHDDIIDRDDTRWGGPNISGLYYGDFSRTLPALEARHFANSWALLAGDLCHGWSRDLLLQSGFSSGRLIKALTVLGDTTEQTLRGELLDVALSLKLSPATGQRLLDVAEAKTAAYSFIAPLVIGAILAGAPKREQDKLVALGRSLGIAFQLQDDMLGMFGQADKMGKPVLSDLREGKMTMLTAFLDERATAAERKEFYGYHGNPKVNEGHLSRAQEIIKACGAYTASENLISEQLQTAHTIIPALRCDRICRQDLTHLLVYLTNRTL